VGGRAPKASFSSPAGGETAQSSTSVRVAWSESGAVAARRLTREAGRVRTPGTCADVRFSVDRTRSVSSPTVESVRPGFCYRWQLTLTDASGAQSSTYSGSVLVDASAPPAPSVSLSGSIERRPNLASLAIGQAYVAGAGMLWVRAGVSGSVAVQVSAGDPESGIAANVAGVEGGRGWSPRWIGASADGSLLLRYGSSGSSARLSVRSVNGAGLTGPTTTAQLLRDGTAPEPVSWLSARPGATRLIKGSYFRLDWGASSDQGSGLAERFIVGRYRADLKPNGECRTNGFSPDGEFRLVTNHSWESGLQPSTCYVWSIRALDNVGNTSASAVSGYVITR